MILSKIIIQDDQYVFLDQFIYEILFCKTNDAEKYIARDYDIAISYECDKKESIKTLIDLLIGELKKIIIFL